jgi:transposase
MWAVEKLFRKGVVAEDFNDFALARTLDAIHAYGETKFFSEIATKIALQYGLFDKTVNLDTTTLSLYGEYENCDKTDDNQSSSSNAIPKYGYAKNKRHDLKQMILLIAKSGPANLPIHMEAHSGNASDKVILEKATTKIKNFCDNLKKVDDFLFVADSAMYDSCVKHGTKISWLSKVPATSKKCKQVLQKNNINWETPDENYKMHPVNNDFSGKNIRWVLFFSQEAYKRESATLDKQVAKEFEEFTKKIWHFENKSFGCEKDLESELNTFVKKMKYHQITHSVQTVKKYSKNGRPSEKDIPEKVLYKAKISLSKNEKEV